MVAGVCLGGGLIRLFLLTRGRYKLFSFFVVVVVIDGINYGKKIYLDICHSYFYDGCC